MNEQIPAMNKPMKWALILVALALAGYGAFRLVSDRLDYSDGKKAVETAHPFVKGASSAAGEKIKETLKNTPDAKLEEDSELLSRKLYPVVKGAVKGQLDAVLNDPNRSEVPEKMVQTGKELVENVVKPFAEGMAQGSSKVLEDVDKGLGEIRKFKEKNKDIFQDLQSGINALRQQLDRGTGNPAEQPLEKSDDRSAPGTPPR